MLFFFQVLTFPFFPVKQPYMHVSGCSPKEAEMSWIFIIFTPHITSETTSSKVRHWRVSLRTHLKSKLNFAVLGIASVFFFNVFSVFLCNGVDRVYLLSLQRLFIIRMILTKEVNSLTSCLALNPALQFKPFSYKNIKLDSAWIQCL